MQFNIKFNVGAYYMRWQSCIKLVLYNILVFYIVQQCKYVYVYVIAFDLVNNFRSVNPIGFRYIRCIPNNLDVTHVEVSRTV